MKTLMENSAKLENDLKISQEKNAKLKKKKRNNAIEFK